MKTCSQLSRKAAARLNFHQACYTGLSGDHAAREAAAKIGDVFGPVLDALRADAAIVAFLGREDITVDKTPDGQWNALQSGFTVRSVMAGHFKGSGINVITAARMAMEMERKYLAEKGKADEPD